MLKEERYDKIIEILEEEKYISVQELSKRLYVSLPTIRRDLTELQKRKLIIRSHAGAKIINTSHAVAPLNFRKATNSVEKRKLCKAAAKLVNEGDVIFIDASTTTLQIAEFLRDKKNITVITNGIPLATLLISNGIKTYSTGGEIFSNSLAHYGSFSEDFIQKFNIDTLILSSHGVNEKGMLIDPSLPETQIRKVALNQSRKTIFLCDKSKFELSAPYNLISIKKMDYIVTNNEEVKKFFKPDDKNEIIIV